VESRRPRGRIQTGVGGFHLFFTVYCSYHSNDSAWFQKASRRRRGDSSTTCSVSWEYTYSW
jgi:hypothetical protein